MFFDSRRSTVHAKNGMVATSQPLAAMAGLKILMDGGNPVDAAVAAAATLNVVEVVSTGVGGDMFALVWNNADKSIRAINGSGRAPAAASARDLRDKGHEEMPFLGVESITVPGTVEGWETILSECGTMPLSEVLKPAIRYAEEGFPVTDYISYQWSTMVEKLSQLPSGQEMLIDGRAPKHGEVMRLPDLGATMRAIAEGGAKAFYTGPIAEKTAAFIQEQGGWMTTRRHTRRTGRNRSPLITAESPAGNRLHPTRASPGWRR